MRVRASERPRRTVNEDLHLVLVPHIHPHHVPLDQLVDPIDHATQPPVRGKSFAQSVRRRQEHDDADDDERGDHRRLARDAVAEVARQLRPVLEVVARARVADRALVAFVAVVGAVEHPRASAARG